MTRKEIKNLAKKIATLEKERATCTDKKRTSAIESEIMELCGKVHSPEDMCMIDEIVIELLG